MSNKYTKVKKYFDNSLWSEKQVKDAVNKGWITAEEFEQITGKAYSE